MLNDQQNQLLREACIISARKVHKRYHTYFDVEDVVQELLAWAYQRADKFEEILVWENEREIRGVMKYLDKTLTRQADKYCRRKKAQHLGYALNDEAYYPATLLTELLPYAFGDVSEAKDTAKPRVSSGGGDPATAGNFIVSLFDVRTALDRLDPDDKMFLFMRFDMGYTYGELAEELDVSETTAERRVKGALQRLTDLLGGDSPFTHRRVMSNAQAINETEKQITG